MADIKGWLKKKADEVKQAFSSPKNYFNATPIGQASNAVQNYFKPTQNVRVRDVVREIPQAYSQVNRNIGNFAKDIAQSTARFGGSVGLSQLQGITGRDMSIAPPTVGPEKYLYKGIFGNEPVNTFQKQTQTADTYLQGKGYNPALSKLGAIGFVGGVAALDNPLMGGGKSKTAKKIAGKVDPKYLKEIGENLLDVIDRTPEQGIKGHLISLYGELAGKKPNESVIKAVEDVIDSNTKGTQILPSRINQVEDYFNNKKLQSKGNEGFATVGTLVPKPIRKLLRIPEEGENFGSLANNTANSSLPLKAGQNLGKDVRSVSPILGDTGTGLLKTQEQKIGSSIGGLPPKSGIGKIGTTQEPDALPFINKAQNYMRDLYTKSINRFQPLETVAKQAGKETEMRNALTGHYGAGSTSTYHVDYELKPIFQGVSADDLRAYTIAQRDIELAGRNIKGSSAEAGQKTLAELQQKYGQGFSQLQESAQKLYQYQDNLVNEYLVKTGIISPENYAAMRAKNQAYIPFKRVMDTVDEYLGVSKAVGSVGSQNVIKGIKGSERQIVDPLESIVENTYKIVSLGKRQEVARTIANLADKLPEGTIIPLRTAENVQKRISLYSEAKELKPLQNLADRLLKTRSRWVRQLQSAINGLEKKGLMTALKAPEKEMPKLNIPTVTTETKKFSNVNLEGTAVGKYMKERNIPQELNQETKRAVGQTFATLKARGEQSTKSFIDALITEPNLDVQKIKKMVATRENKLGDLLDEVQGLREQYDAFHQYRGGLIDEARMLKDAESRGKQTISVFKNGIKEVYEVPAEIAEAAKGLNEESLNTIVKILAAPTKVFRATATGVNPEFFLSNIARDMQSAFINAGVNPIDWVRGFSHYMKGDDVYQQFLKSGGLTSRISIDKPAIQRTVQEITGTVADSPKKLLDLFDPRNIYKGLEKLGQASEQPTRIAAFERTLKKGGNLQDAAYQAQEATTNFARRGSATKSVNALYAFMNARVQGTDRLIRTAIKQPGTTATRIGMITMAPALATYAYNRQFPEYFDERVVSKYDKENNFIVMAPWLGENRFIKVPKGDVGKLANPLEAFLSYADKKGGNIASAIGQALVAFLPGNNVGDVIPTSLKPIVETAMNKNFFTGYDIVPDYKKDFPKPKQDNASTAPVYRLAGRVTGQSPAKIQNLTQGYLTGFARIGESALNPLVPSQYVNKKNIQGDSVNRTPIIRRFIGGEKKTEEEQMIADEKKQQSQVFEINDIKSGVKRGELTPVEGQAAIDKITGKIPQKTSQPPILTDQAKAADDSTYELAGRLYSKNPGVDSVDLEKIKAAVNLPTSSKFEKAIKEDESWKVARTLKGFSEQTRQPYLDQLGISKEEYEYDSIASKDNDIKAEYVADVLENTESENILKVLEPLRQTVNGKQILAPGIIDDMYDAGLLTSEQRSYLKSIKEYDPKTGTVTIKPSKPKKLRAAKKLSLPKITVSAPKKAARIKVKRAPRIKVAKRQKIKTLTSR